MVIKIPQHHHFPQAWTKKGVQKTGWEITVPRRDDAAWSIVLFYLISTNYRDRKDFKRRLEELTGNDEISSERVQLAKKAIRNYNPFRNRYSCFYDPTLKWTVQEFKKNSNWISLTTITQKFVAAARLLNSQILHIRNDEIKSIHPNSLKVTEEANSVITLISSAIGHDEDAPDRGTVCNFILSAEFGSKLRVSALTYFLREAEFSRNSIRKIISLEDNDNFLISLLKSDFRTLVLDIYKNPYIVTKLSEAAYQTDPRLTDQEGLSGLYYALLTEDSEIFYTLYYFAANSCFETEGSLRSPDAHIVSNFYDLEKIFHGDLSKSNSFDLCVNRNVKRKLFDELLMVNRFLLEINQKILNTKEKVNYYDDVKEDVFETCKRRDTIVSVLDTYEKFFDGVKEENLNISPLQNYVMHKNFYFSIDIIMTMIFFEKIFHLKERLSFENEKIYSNIESCLFSLVLYNIKWDGIFPSFWYEKKSPYYKSGIDTLYAFPLMKRLEVRDKVTEFSGLLQSTVIGKENVVECLPESEVYAVLNSLPVIKDFFQITRLNHYLDTAQETKIIDIKSVLVIERVLQVIGEYIQPERDNSFSVREILPLYLPPETARILRRLRNELSHLKGHQFSSKISAEKDYYLFQLIKKEINSIKVHFNPVFRVQLLQLHLYILKEFKESVVHMKKFKQLCSQHPLHSCENLLFMINGLFHERLQDYVGDYKYVVECILNHLRKEIKDKEFWENSLEHIINQVQIKLRVLTYLTELLSYYHKGQCEALLKEIDTIKNRDKFASSLDAKEKFLHILSRYESSFSNFFASIKRKKFRRIKSIENIENIEKFLKILRGFTYLSDEDKCKIREAIPPAVKESAAIKEMVIRSIADGFSLNMDEQFIQFDKLCLPNKKLKQLHKCYQSKKSSEALEILTLPGLPKQLEEALSENRIDKKKYEVLCEKMQFSEEISHILGKLVSGQKQKISKSNIEILLNRIQLLRKIVIEENKEIFELWTKIKSKKSQQYFVGKIIQRYLDERQFQASVEMLLFDCMMLVGNQMVESEKVVNKNVGNEEVKSGKDGKEVNEEDKKCIVKLWIKSSRLYSGVDLRNIISHGNPLLENLCLLLDPYDLSSAIIDNALRLIKKEEAVKAMLERHKGTNCDPTVLQMLLFNTEDKHATFPAQSGLW